MIGPGTSGRCVALVGVVLTVTVTSVMTARMSSLRWALVVAGAWKMARRSAPAVVIQAVSSSVRVTGRRACWAASWFSAVRTAVSLSSRTASRVRGDQPVLRLDVVVLAQRPAGFERARSSARSNTARFWRNWASVSDMAWTVAARQAGASAASSSASTVSCSRRPPIRWQVLAPYIWLRASAPVGGAAAGVVGDLHEPPAPAAAQQALQPGRAFPRGAAGAAGRRRGVGGQPGDVGVVGFQGDVAGMVAGDHHGPLVAGQPPLPGDHVPAGVQVLFGLAAPVGEHPGIAGMDQDVVHGRVAGLRPCDLPGADVPPGQPQAVGAEADDHLPGRAELVKAAEHAHDRFA